MSTSPHTANEPFFRSIDATARRLGVSASWLRDQVREGNVPSLRTGKKALLNLEQVQEALAARAKQFCLEGDDQ